MAGLSVSRYTLDVKALRDYLLSKGLTERTNKWNKVWFRYMNKFRKAVK